MRIDSLHLHPIVLMKFGSIIEDVQSFVVQSFVEFLMRIKTIPFHVATLIAESYPLRGADAEKSMQSHFAKMTDNAAKSGLTEQRVNAMLNDDFDHYDRMGCRESGERPAECAWEVI